MHYEGTVIRPPSEAGSIILQVAVGCPHNRCSFCGSYKDKIFRVKDEATIEADLDFVSLYCRRHTSMFLADGDVLSLPQNKLVSLFSQIREKTPGIKRIRLYARADSILEKTSADLQELKDLGLDRIYMGLESGSDQVLSDVRKGVNSRDMVLAAQRVREETGLFLSATVLLGLGGTEYSTEHALQTGNVLSGMQPNQIAVLTLMLLPNTDLYLSEKCGKFNIPNPEKLLSELHLLIENTRLRKNCQFQANHPSNYLPLNGRLPRDRERLLEMIAKGISGRLHLKQESARML